MVDSVLGDGARVVTLLTTRRRVVTLERRVLRRLGEVVQDPVHVLFAQEELPHRINLVKDLLEPDLVSCKRLSKAFNHSL